MNTICFPGRCESAAKCHTRNTVFHGRAVDFIRLAYLLLLTIAAATPAFASATAGIRITGDTVPVKVYALVNTNDGTPIGGLSSGAFQISEDGSSQAINNFTATTDIPVTTVFVMDYSVSMVDSGALSPMQEAVKSFIDLMKPADEAAIIKFNGDIGVVVMQALTSDKALLKTAVDTNPGGLYWTNLYDAIDKGIDVANLSTNTAGSRILVVLTDGDDNRSSLSLSSLSTKLDAADIPVFTIGLGNDINASLLRGLADNTGGKYAATSSTGDLTGIYTQIAERLNNEYLLTYYSALSDCNVHLLKVTVATTEGEKIYTGNFSRCFSTAPLTLASSSGGGGGAAGMFELIGFAVLIGLGRLVRRAGASVITGAGNIEHAA